VIDFLEKNLGEILSAKSRQSFTRNNSVDTSGS